MKIKFSPIMVLTLIMLLPIDVIAKKDVYSGHEKSFDYIIVGFGSAGAILARQLSNKKHGKYKHSVLVLEAGQNNMEDPNTLDPNAIGPATQELEYSPKYSITYPLPLGPVTATLYTEGREWGGSAATNNLETVRGVPSNWNDMAANAGDNRWLYDNVLPWMIDIETYTGSTDNPSQRGFDGNIYVTQKPSIVNNSFAQFIANVTMSPFGNDYNDQFEPDNMTSASQQYVTPSGLIRRSFSAYDFMTIGKIMDEKGRGLKGRKVRVKGNAVVARILFDDKKAIGVEYIRNKPSKQNEQVRQVYAKKQIIVCTGAINTPALLMRSGIGDKTVLKNLGIDVVLDNPNVGQHLQDHYGATAVVTNSNPIPGGQLENFFDVPLGGPVRRIQNIVIEAPGSGIADMLGIIIQPKSVGSIEIVSKDPLIKPKINAGLYSDGPFNIPGTDANLIVEFYNVVQDIATAAGETVLFPTAADYAAGNARLAEVARTLPGIFIAYHAAGTARVSSSIFNGVVDGKLRVHKIKNLMIADMSVAWPITSGNTAMQAYVVAAVAADVLGVPLS